MKRGFIWLIIILAVLILGVVIFFFLRGIVIQSTGGDEKLCNQDSDCVPATPCHATSCTLKAMASENRGIFCSQECQPGTLDCGQGSCSCVNHKCTAVFK